MNWKYILCVWICELIDQKWKTIRTCLLESLFTFRWSFDIVKKQKNKIKRLTHTLFIFRRKKAPKLSNFQFQTICRSQRSAHASLQRLNSTAGVLAQDLSQQVLEVQLVILFDLPSQFSIPTMNSYCCLQKESWSWFVDPFSFLYCFSLNSAFDVLLSLADAF